MHFKLIPFFLFLLFSLSSYATNSAPQWKGFDTEEWGQLDSNLRSLAKAGKPVTLVLQGGVRVSGKIKAISKQGMIIVTELEGREFYDGAYNMASIIGVETRVR